VDPPLGEGVTLPHKTQMSDLSRQDVNRADRLGFDDAIFTLAPEGLGSAQSALGRTRLRTFITLRWLAVAGQTAAVLFVAFVLHFDLPLAACLAIIAASAWLNVFLSFAFQSQRLTRGWEASLQLAFDTVQLAALVAVTGGLSNPFLLLLVAPVTVAALSLSPTRAVLIALLALTLAAIMPLISLPLPWINGAMVELPPLFHLGQFAALAVGVVFFAVSAGRVSQDEAKLVRALDAASIVMAREQKLSAIGAMSAMTTHELGTPLATIHLVAKELLTETPQDDPKYEDLTLLAGAGRPVPQHSGDHPRGTRSHRHRACPGHAGCAGCRSRCALQRPGRRGGSRCPSQRRRSRLSSAHPEPEPRNPPRHQRLRGERRELRRFPGDRAGQLDR
jgi:two-component system sensor histidine kinase RegB